MRFGVDLLVEDNEEEADRAASVAAGTGVC
jgi:hypothetical protein